MLAAALLFLTCTAEVINPACPCSEHAVPDPMFQSLSSWLYGSHSTYCSKEFPLVSRVSRSFGI